MNKIKKLAITGVAAGLFLTSAAGVFAAQPANPGCVGEGVSAQGMAGIRNEVVASVKAGTAEKNFGQAIQAWKGPACGLPAGN